MNRIERLDFDEPQITLAEWTEALMANGMRLREQRIQVLLQPKPWWLPKPVWYWLVQQMIVVVELP